MREPLDPQEALARLRAAFDQARESTKETAKMVADYYHALLKEDVPSDAALGLAAGFQSVLLTVLLSSTPDSWEEDADA